MLLSLAAFLDRWESRVRRIGERLGYPQAWLREFSAYRGDPRLTLEEFWCKYTRLREQEQPKLRDVTTEAEALDFYTTSDYMLVRNLVHRRHEAWRRVLWTMKGHKGVFLEYGCGIAPISAWVRRHRPAWRYRLVDVDSPHRRYGEWRVCDAAATPYLYSMRCSVTTAIDVFEHLSDPLDVARWLVTFLVPGGYLHWNAVRHEQAHELNLATPEQMDAAEAYLLSALTLVWQRDNYRVSWKP